MKALPKLLDALSHAPRQFGKPLGAEEQEPNRHNGGYLAGANSKH